MVDVEIGWRRQLTTETRPWSVDLSAELDAGDVPSAPTAALTDLLTGLAYSAGLPVGPSLVGNVVTQSVSQLVAGHSYRLILSANMGGSKVTSVVLFLSCPY